MFKGLHHEHSHNSRDHFITVNKNSIDTGKDIMFEKYSSQPVSYLPYDIKSIMHFDAFAFTKAGQPTLISKQAGVQLLPASQKVALSATDVQKIRILYNCL